MTRFFLALAVLFGTVVASPAREVFVDTQAEFQQACAGLTDGDNVWLDPRVAYSGPCNLTNKHCDNIGCAFRGQGGVARIWGMRAEVDWQPAGEGRYSRFMQPAVDPLPTNQPDGIDLPTTDPRVPMNIFQSNVNGKPWESLGYVGDNSFTPGPGQYSYHRGSGMIVAMPYNGQPISQVYVPYLWRMVEMLGATGHFTFENTEWIGSRGNMFHNGGQRLASVTMNSGGVFAFSRFGQKFHTRAFWSDGWVCRQGCRGISERPNTNNTNGCYCFRLFGLEDGCMIQNFLQEDFGAHNRDCPNCGAPWNRTGVVRNGVYVLEGGHTLYNAYAEAIDLKQGHNCTVRNFILRRGPIQGAINVDSSHHIVIEDGFIDGWTTGVDLMVQTPNSATGHTASYENTVQRVEVRNAQTGIDFDGSYAIPPNTFRGYQGGNSFVNVAQPFGIGLPQDVVTIGGTLPTTSTSTTSSSSTSTTTSTRPPTTSSSTSTSSTSTSTSSSSTSSSTSTAPPTTVPACWGQEQGPCLSGFSSFAPCCGDMVCAFGISYPDGGLCVTTTWRQTTTTSSSTSTSSSSTSTSSSSSTSTSTAPPTTIPEKLPLGAVCEAHSDCKSGRCAWRWRDGWFQKICIRKNGQLVKKGKRHHDRPDETSLVAPAGSEPRSVPVAFTATGRDQSLLPLRRDWVCGHREATRRRDLGSGSRHGLEEQGRADHSRRLHSAPRRAADAHSGACPA